MYEFCSGKHECQICGDKYDCKGVDFGHSGSKGYLCNGPYIQFCTNHTVNEYIEQHKKNGEL
jgi:hypothetical protein